MPHNKFKMSDLIVVLPGILGSVLQKDGKTIWGLSFGSVIRNIFSLGRALDALKLPNGIGHDDPNDGVRATSLMPNIHLLPGLWKIDGYSSLLGHLEDRFELRRPSAEVPGNLIEFPYDWRLSNRLNGKRLANAVLPALDRWRTFSNNPAAKMVFICHSMGGLVARSFLEDEAGAELTSKLITLGTPYRGSINALNALSNGVDVPLAPLRDTIDEIVKTMPAVHQLLPTYACVGEGNDLKALDAIGVPNLDAGMVADAFAFHKGINDKAAQGTKYEVFPLKGIIQPTFQTAALRTGRIVPLHIFKGEDRKGDGTVPRRSSHPPEWANDGKAVFFSQQHPSLQADSDLHRQIDGILTSDADTFLNMRAEQDIGGDRLGIDLPEMVASGHSLEIVAKSDLGDDEIRLQAELRHEDGRRLPSVLLRPEGGGRHQASIGEIAPGAYQVRISSTLDSSPVSPVTGLTVVWDDAAAAEG
ncbi:MAG: hypothetical protein M3Q19_06300 [Pseudomonadota bacterium]|nr:hypothetical protein [Pseudomonadota bacterium]